MSVWEQHQYDAPLAGWQASQGREQQVSVAALSIWEALYLAQETGISQSSARNTTKLLILKLTVKGISS